LDEHGALNCGNGWVNEDYSDVAVKFFIVYSRLMAFRLCLPAEKDPEIMDAFSMIWFHFYNVVPLRSVCCLTQKSHFYQNPNTSPGCQDPPCYGRTNGRNSDTISHDVQWHSWFKWVFPWFSRLGNKKKLLTATEERWLPKLPECQQG
jgi:hypothetical protein